MNTKNSRSICQRDRYDYEHNPASQGRAAEQLHSNYWRTGLPLQRIDSGNAGLLIKRQERLGNWEDVQLQHSTIIVPVMVSSEYSQLRAEFRAGSIYSRVSKGSAPFGSFNGSGLPHSQQPAQLSREDSFKSSISMHSEHLIEEDELLSPKQINSKQQIPFP